MALWFTLSSDMFASYIPSYADSKTQKSAASLNSEIQVPEIAISGGVQPAISEATKSLSILPGVKRNVTDFPKLTSDGEWFIFKRLFKSSASAQGLWHVFNPDPECFYIPVGEQQEKMWQLEQAYGFRVLVHCFQTVKSRAVVRGLAAKENDDQAAFAVACDK